MIKKPESKNITLKEKEINNLIEEKKLNVESVETLKVNKIKPKLKPKAPEQIKAISDVVIENKTKPEIKKRCQNYRHTKTCFKTRARF